VPKLFSHFFRVRLLYIYCGLADPKGSRPHLCLGQCWSSCVVSPSILSSTPPPPLPTCLLFLFLFFCLFCFYFHYSLTYSLSSMVDSFVCVFFYRTSLICFESCTKKAVPALLRSCCASNNSWFRELRLISFSLSRKALLRSFAWVRWRAIYLRGHIRSFFLHIQHPQPSWTWGFNLKKARRQPFFNIVPIFTILKLNFTVCYHIKLAFEAVSMLTSTKRWTRFFCVPGSKHEVRQSTIPKIGLCGPCSCLFRSLTKAKYGCKHPIVMIFYYECYRPSLSYIVDITNSDILSPVQPNQKIFRLLFAWVLLFIILSYA